MNWFYVLSRIRSTSMYRLVIFYSTTMVFYIASLSVLKNMIYTWCIIIIIIMKFFSQTVTLPDLKDLLQQQMGFDHGKTQSMATVLWVGNQDAACLLVCVGLMCCWNSYFRGHVFRPIHDQWNVINGLDTMILEPLSFPA